VSLTETIREHRRARLTWFVVPGLMLLVCSCTFRTGQYGPEVSQAGGSDTDTLVVDRRQFHSSNDTIQSVPGETTVATGDLFDSDSAVAAVSAQNQSARDDGEVKAVDEFSLQLPVTNSSVANDEIDRPPNLSIQTGDTLHVLEKAVPASDLTMPVFDTIKIDSLPSTADLVLMEQSNPSVNGAVMPRDSDRDGVADIDDHCPDTPRGLYADSTGCLAMTQLNRQLTLRISHTPGTTDLDRLSRRILDDLAIRLTEMPGIVAVIKGFTDEIGQNSSSVKVSQMRVRMIVQYLAQKGIDKKRIKALDIGESLSQADDPGFMEQRKNSQIEISFYSTDE
jgi:outer membrane protein OmpA-like peptidoglycan-associated protein